MRRVAVIAALTLLALPAGASAAQSPSVRVKSCDAAAGTATFTGDMRTVPGAGRLQMRFTIQVRSHGGDWARVAAPNAGVWVSSGPGRARYVYDKHLTGLQPGATRVLVRFRWRAPDGTTLRTAVRRSHACRVPDRRPDLRPLSITTGPGASPGSVAYAVTVANRGRTTADPSSVSLDVGDTVLPDAALPALAPGQRAVAWFEGPPCAAGQSLVTVADATGLVDEAQEADDVLTVPCG